MTEEALKIPCFEKKPSAKEALASLNTAETVLSVKSLTLIDQQRLEDTLGKLVESAKVSLQETVVALEKQSDNPKFAEIKEVTANLTVQFAEILAILNELRRTDDLKRQVLEKLNRVLP